MIDKTDTEKAKSTVLSFTSKMNKWGIKSYHRSRYESDDYEFTKNKDLRLGGEKSLEELNKDYYEILNLYCTQRERKFGGHPNVYGEQYSGITEESILDITKVDPNKIELICEEQGNMFQTFKFILFKKGDSWLIDNAFWKESDSWERHYL